MKKITFAIAALVMSFVTLSARAGAQDFVLVNATEHNIRSVYISSSGTSSWESDLLKGYLNAGDWTKFTFNGFSDDNWDIKIVYRDSKPDAIFTGVKLKTITKIVLRDNAQGGTTATSHHLEFRTTVVVCQGASIRCAQLFVCQNHLFVFSNQLER